MIEFKYSGDELYARMERAVEKVYQRMRRTVAVLEEANIPYAIVGGFAVRAWVAQIDEAAVRNTRDVDVLVRAEDLPAIKQAMGTAGFHHRNTSGLDMFVEHPDASASDAVHLVLADQMLRAGDVEPNPRIEPTTQAGEFRTLPLERLVRMKLNSFRDKDRVHLRDMISLEMIDETWLTRFPVALRTRLEELLRDPDG